MSNDLISRKALINALFVRNGKMCPDTDIDNFPITINVKDVKKAIRNAPTAYDVDKVVEQIRKFEICGRCLNNHNSVEVCAEFCDVGKKLRIIKSGGIE